MTLEPLQALEEERAARAEAEVARRRFEFLAEAGAVLSSSLDYETTLASAARLAVPHLADWCAVDVLDEDGEIRRLEVLHADPAKTAWLRDGKRRYAPPLDAPCGVASVVRTGKSEFYPEIGQEIPADGACAAEPMWTDRFLGSRSALIVPLRGQNRMLGAITLVMAGSGRRYTPEDLGLAEELARRAALAAENASLYAAEQRVRQAMQRAADRLERLQQITAALSEALTSARVADVILDQGLAALEANAGVVAALTADGARLQCLGIAGYSPEAAETWRDFPLDAPLPLAEAVRTGEMLVFETREERDARYPDLADLRALGGDGALVALPLLFHGRAVGGIRLSFPEARTFVREDHAFLRVLAELCAQALERARLYDAAQEEIAERRRAEEALRASQERFRLAVDSFPGAFVLYGPDLRFRYVNARATTNTGRSQAAFLGHTDEEIFPPEFTDLFLPALRRTAESRTPQTVECTLTEPAGQATYIVHYVPLLDAQNEIREILGTAYDITQRKQIEEALRESREQFARIFRSSPVVTSIATLPEERFVDVNDNFLRALGLRRDEVIGRTASELGMWVDPEQRRQVVETLIERRALHNIELPCRTRAGEIRQTLTSMEAIELGGQQCVLAMGLDITERKRTEAALRASEEVLRASTEALRESEERFRSAFDNAAVGMALVGTDGRFLQVNRSLGEILGYEPEALLARDFQSVTHPDDLDLDLEYVRRMLAGEIRTYEMKKRYLHKRGHAVPALLSVSTVRDAEDRLLYFIAQIQERGDGGQEKQSRIGES